jgi:hypothetical protein
MSSQQNQVSQSITPQDAAPSEALTGPQRRRRQAQALRDLRARLPSYIPSPRHLEIFELVMFRHKHQMEVAATYGISQQRVSKIVRQVKDWVAAWGGEDVRYSWPERFRIAAFVAARELSELMRDVRFEIDLCRQDFASTRVRHAGNGDRQWIDRATRRYPTPAALFRVLLNAILASAKFQGAGNEFDRTFDQDGTSQGPVHNSQSMVLRAEINVNRPGSIPPVGELCADKLSGPTCAPPLADSVVSSADSPKSLDCRRQGPFGASDPNHSKKTRCTAGQVRHPADRGPSSVPRPR